MSSFYNVDDLTMNRNLLFFTVITVIFIISGTLCGCKSEPPVAAPPAVPPPVEEPVAEEPIKQQPVIIEDDVWDLLQQGDGEKVRPFFIGKVEANARDKQGRTPLHIVAEIGRPDLASFFVALGGEVDALDQEGRTPLDISAEKLDSATARVLAASGGDIHHEMQDNLSPARIGIESDIEFFKALLNPGSLESTGPSGRNVLHLASEYGSIDALNAVLEAGKNNLGKKDRSNKTALDIALESTGSRNHAEVAEKLILAGAFSENPLFAQFAPAVLTANYNIRSGDGMTPLHYFARGGYSGYISYALERQADVNIKNASGAVPLHEAARSGDLRVMEALLDHGADVNAQDAKGNSVLHIAIPPQSHEAALRLFLSRNANPNLQDEHGETPMHVAIILNRSPNVVRTLLANGADLGIRNINGKTPLYLAVEEERAGLVPLLLSANADIFAADINGFTPYELALTDKFRVLSSLVSEKTVVQSDSQGNTILHYTIRHGGNTEILEWILDKNAPVNARNKEGESSLHLAVRLNDEEAGLLLLSRGADIFASNDKGESPLYLSFPGPGKDPSELRQWMLNPQTLSVRDGLGNTALHYTAQWQLEEWIPALIRMGADTEAANATGETPLFSAVKYNGSSTIRVLDTAGARLDSRDTLGNSALHAAVRWNALEAAETLIALGLDVNCHALNGKTPLHDAVRMGAVEIETLLLNNRADLEARDTEGNTPFMEAVLPGDSAAMVRLVEKGADSNTRNFRGNTSLHLAAAMGREDMASLLLGWGASIHARNSLDRTPFHNALAVSTQMVKTLLAGNQIFSSDDYGASPLHIAIQENASLDLIKTIMAMGGRISAVDFDGRTPLRVAVDNERWDAAGFLADQGVDVYLNARDGKNPAEITLTKGENAIQALFSGRAINSRDASGNTILHYAARMGDTAVIEQLIELGANKNTRNIASESPADIAQRWRHTEAEILLN